MALTYKGLYYITIQYGQLVFPVFESSTALSNSEVVTISWAAGSSIEGAILSTRYNNTLKRVQEPVGVTDTSMNLSFGTSSVWSFKRGTSSITNGTWMASCYSSSYNGDVILPILIKSPQNDKLYPCSSPSFTKTSSNYSCTVVEPQSTKMGYGVVSFPNGYSTTISIGLALTDSEIISLFNNAKIWREPTQDPYGPGGNSGTGGGTGNFDGSSTSIPIPGLPSLSAVDAGFITLFNPSATQLKNLATYMWDNPLFDLTNWKKIFADPMDAILGLSIVPVAVPNGGTGSVKVGNIDTGVSMTLAASQYVQIDCGTLNVNEYWGSYLDYEPNTKAQLYLPFIGTRPISVDDIMNKAVHVVYNIDILSGACCAFVECGGTVLYTFNGQCSASIPITGGDFTDMINGIITAGVAVGSLVGSGGATAPLAVPALASTAINTMKPDVEKSGALAGTGGMLGIQVPYIILTRPKQALPQAQNYYMGYPSHITYNLGVLTGFTVVEEVHLEQMSCTQEELSEIERLLKEGVVL